MTPRQVSLSAAARALNGQPEGAAAAAAAAGGEGNEHELNFTSDRFLVHWWMVDLVCDTLVNKLIVHF